MKVIDEVMTVQELMPQLFKLEIDKPYRIEISTLSKKRSLNANAYAWALINKIANALKLSKEEVYLNMLRDYGQSEVIAVRPAISLKGYFKYFEETRDVKIGDAEYIEYKVYKGSSSYDAEEMAILIDGIVNECKTLGIETMTPDELENLKALWQSQS